MRRERKNLSPVSLTVFSLVPDLLFDYSRVLEYAKIPTVLRSTFKLAITATIVGNQHTSSSVKSPSCLEWTLVTMVRLHEKES